MTTHFRLGEGVPRDAIEDLCRELGFRLANVVARAPHHPAQSIFVTPDRRTTLHLLEDEAQGRAVVLQGARAEELVSRMLRSLAGAPAPGRPASAPAAAPSGAAEPATKKEASAPPATETTAKEDAAAPPATEAEPAANDDGAAPGGGGSAAKEAP